MKAVGIESRKQIAPVTQVSARRPRQAAMKNLPHRCTTMKKKKSSVLQRCMLLKKWPTLEPCHHAGPARASTAPEKRTTASEASVSTPKT